MQHTTEREAIQQQYLDCKNWENYSKKLADLKNKKVDSAPPPPTRPTSPYFFYDGFGIIAELLLAFVLFLLAFFVLYSIFYIFAKQYFLGAIAEIFPNIFFRGELFSSSIFKGANSFSGSNYSFGFRAKAFFSSFGIYASLIASLIIIAMAVCAIVFLILAISDYRSRVRSFPKKLQEFESVTLPQYNNVTLPKYNAEKTRILNQISSEIVATEQQRAICAQSIVNLSQNGGLASDFWHSEILFTFCEYFRLGRVFTKQEAVNLYLAEKATQSHYKNLEAQSKVRTAVEVAKAVAVLAEEQKRTAITSDMASTVKSEQRAQTATLSDMASTVKSEQRAQTASVERTEKNINDWLRNN
ncbi:MAG: hypothetical protein FWD49_03090 [Firmicutes bacterium]|nr:hypothetical protein [Bacillota bacterium]